MGRDVEKGERKPAGPATRLRGVYNRDLTFACWPFIRLLSHWGLCAAELGRKGWSGPANPVPGQLSVPPPAISISLTSD